MPGTIIIAVVAPFLLFYFQAVQVWEGAVREGCAVETSTGYAFKQEVSLTQAEIERKVLMPADAVWELAVKYGCVVETSAGYVWKKEAEELVKGLKTVNE